MNLATIAQPIVKRIRWKMSRLGEHVRPMRSFERATWTGPAAVTLTFDDGRTEDRSRMVPILDRLGVRGVFAITTDLIGRPGYLGREEIRALHDEGHEIASHLDAHLALPMRPKADIANGLSHSRAILEDLIGAPVTTVIYPYGEHNRGIREQSMSTFTLGVGSSRGINADRFNRFAVRRFAIGSYCRPGEDNLAAYRQALTESSARRGWLVAMIHPAAPGHNRRQDEYFETFLAEVIDGRVPTMTCQAALAGFTAA